MESGDHGIFGRIREEGAAIARPGFLTAWRKIIGGPSVPQISLVEPAVGNLIGTR
jgi:hypothetical protein